MNMSKNILLFSPADCLVIARKEMEKSNLLQVSQSRKRSYYFSKTGVIGKIRISNHNNAIRNYDVVFDIVFKNSTTKMNVEYIVKKAITELSSKTRKPYTLFEV